MSYLHDIEYNYCVIHNSVQEALIFEWRFITFYRIQRSKPSPEKETQKGKMEIIF